MGTHDIRMHGAYTLVEVTIAVLILAVAAAMSVEASLASARHAALASAQDTITDDGHEILRTICEDLGASAWQFADDQTSYSVEEGWRRDGSSDGGILPSGVNFATDRGLRYYPFVLQQTSNGTLNTEGLPQGSSPKVPMTWFKRAGNQLNTPSWPAVGQPFARGVHWPLNLPGKPTDRDTVFSNPTRNAAQYKRYIDSFFARSQELVFLKTTAGGWPRPIQIGNQCFLQRGEPATGIRGTVADWQAAQAQIGTANDTLAWRQGLGVSYASPWRRLTANATAFDYVDPTLPAPWDPLVSAPQVYGRELSAARVNANASGNLNVQLNWETMRDTSLAPQNGPLPQGFANNLREYTYAVIPCPGNVGQLGRLVRAYRDDPGFTPSADQYIASGTVLVTTTAGAASVPTVTTSKTVYVIIDRVLSDSVVRVVFDTARTDPNLRINQVRIRLYLARRVEGSDMGIFRRLECLATLNSRSSNPDMTNDLSALGSVPFPY